MTEEKKGIIQAVKDHMNDLLDQTFNNATLEAYKKYYPRWCKICEVETIEEIDYTNPYVEIESKLCDVRNLKMIRKGRHTEDFLKLLSSDEARKLYYAKDENGDSYSDLEHPKIMSSFIAGIRRKCPGNREIARALREFEKED